MAKYFTVMQGLRGCYMPDSVNVIKCDTRRELKNAIEWEARDIREAGFIGANKKGVAALAAHMWREAKKEKPSFYPNVLPYGTKGNYHSAIHVSVATRREYLEQQND
jgi:hypothetical protein